MSYIINKTDGTILTEIVDGTIDQIKTDVTLVGKNATSYGEFFNENFIKLLENFANTSQPNKPLEGQLWYDTAEGRLKVYDGQSFKVSGGTIVASAIPSSISSGDIWIDSYRQQMYFNDGTANLLAGPIYTAQQGMSGWNVVDIVDTNQINHTTLFLYVGQVLLGIFSNSSTEFTPATAIPGYAGTIKLGFNSADITGFKFNVPSSQADALLSADGVTLKTAESFLQVSPQDGFTISNGTIRILNNVPLVLGASQNVEVKLTNNTLQFNSNISGQNFEIQSLNNNGLLPSLFVDAVNQRIGIYTEVPAATLDVAGDVNIQGDLTVQGALTSISTTNVEIKDKLIELAKVESPSNTTADGGGISVVAGLDNDKTFTYSSSHIAWDSSESINIASGKTLKIGNQPVLSSGAVYVSSAPNLTSVGTLTSLQVANIGISGNTISYVNVGIADGDVKLDPKGAGAVNVSGSKITNLLYTEDNLTFAPTTSYGPTDAAPVRYVDYKVRSASAAFSANIAPYGPTDRAVFAAQVLIKIFPLEEYELGTSLRVYCPDAVGLGHDTNFLVFTRDIVAWVFNSYIT